MDLNFFTSGRRSKVKADSSSRRLEMMFFLLLLLFLAVPLAEILVIVEVAQRTGIIETIALLLIVSILGAWLVKSEGMGVIRKIQFQLIQGQIQNKEIFIKNPFSAHISIHVIDYSIFKLQNSIIFEDLSHIYLFIPFFPKISCETRKK